MVEWSNRAEQFWVTSKPLHCPISRCWWNSSDETSPTRVSLFMFRFLPMEMNGDNKNLASNSCSPNKHVQDGLNTVPTFKWGKVPPPSSNRIAFQSVTSCDGAGQEINPVVSCFKVASPIGWGPSECPGFLHFGLFPYRHSSFTGVDLKRKTWSDHVRVPKSPRWKNKGHWGVGGGDNIASSNAATECEVLISLFITDDSISELFQTITYMHTRTWMCACFLRCSFCADAIANAASRGENEQQVGTETTTNSYPECVTRSFLYSDYEKRSDCNRYSRGWLMASKQEQKLSK